MKHLIAVAIGLLVVLSLLACAKTPVILEEVVVQNATDGKITDVRVKHEPTNKFGAVNAILPHKSLEIGLSSAGVPMLAKKATVYWKDSRGMAWKVNLDLPYKKSLAENKRPVKLIYIIYRSGQATVQLQEF